MTVIFNIKPISENDKAFFIKIMLHFCSELF